MLIVGLVGLSGSGYGLSGSGINKSSLIVKSIYYLFPTYSGFLHINQFEAYF